MNQLDLFVWADSRPTAIVLDARPRIQRRIDSYMTQLFMGRKDLERDADILSMPRGKGAA